MSDFYNDFLYRVKVDPQTGCENIADIAKKFSVPPIAVLKGNCIEGELYPGQILIIKRLQKKQYTVKIGDTVSSICKKFNIIENEFLSLNGIEYVFYGLTVYV